MFHCLERRMQNFQLSPQITRIWLNFWNGLTSDFLWLSNLFVFHKRRYWNYFSNSKLRLCQILCLELSRKYWICNQSQNKQKINSCNSIYIFQMEREIEKNSYFSFWKNDYHIMMSKTENLELDFRTFNMKIREI
jgi:hypothetical protein